MLFMFVFKVYFILINDSNELKSVKTNKNSNKF